MPKVFLVKRRNPGVSVRSWDDLPDEKRADAYIPVGLGHLLHDPPEDCRSDGGSSSGGGSSSAGEPGGAEGSSSPRAPEPGDAEGPDGQLAAKQRPVARSKIKRPYPSGLESGCGPYSSSIVALRGAIEYSRIVGNTTYRDAHRSFPGLNFYDRLLKGICYPSRLKNPFPPTLIQLELAGGVL
ncbi:PREDICTED: transcription factor Ovo-like 2 [Galeopterus variegatus]|uniref:Transcription factor Ovo-like 2 n=1 Tax=Galeopterus variegatus TaxID=482537 RepID=A0ABM0RS54_GALVR|nr:PREDICTED: transcription factor Ovo-like 2 [Galeopterus variegatus]